MFTTSLIEDNNEWVYVQNEQMETLIKNKPNISQQLSPTFEGKPIINENLFSNVLSNKSNELVDSNTNDSTIKQMKPFHKIVLHFDVELVHKVKAFICNKCKLKAKDLQLISLHLKLKHFIHQ